MECSSIDRVQRARICVGNRTRTRIPVNTEMTASLRRLQVKMGITKRARRERIRDEQSGGQREQQYSRKTNVKIVHSFSGTRFAVIRITKHVTPEPAA